MPVPRIISTRSTGSAVTLPPMKIGSDFYWAASQSITAADNKVRVFKANGGDPYSTWAIQDTSNEPNVTTEGFGSAAAIADGTMIHIVTSTIEGVDDFFLKYHSFDTTDDTWNVTSEDIATWPNVAGVQFSWAQIAVRSDGDVIVVYAGDVDKVMGDTKHRVDYARREGSPQTWTADIALDSDTADIHYGNPCIVKSATSDDMHIIHQKSAAAADPWSVWVTTEGRTLDPSNNLSTIQSVSTDGDDIQNPYSDLVSYDDGGTTRIVGIGVDGAALTDIISPAAVEDGSDDLSSFTAQQDSVGEDINDSGNAIGGVVDADGRLHVIYRTNLNNTDVTYTRSEDNGATWRSGQLTLDDIGTSASNMRGVAIYDRGGLKMAYVFNRASLNNVYHEHVITPTIEEMTFRPENTLLRM